MQFCRHNDLSALRQCCRRVVLAGAKYLLAQILHGCFARIVLRRDLLLVFLEAASLYCRTTHTSCWPIACAHFEGCTAGAAVDNKQCAVERVPPLAASSYTRSSRSHKSDILLLISRLIVNRAGAVWDKQHGVDVERRRLLEATREAVSRGLAAGNMWHTASHAEHARPMLQVGV